MGWKTQSIASRQFTCGHCGNLVASSAGWANDTTPKWQVYICSHCHKPSSFLSGVQTPGVAPGKEVAHLPEAIAALYAEARKCVAASCYTAAVLVARKLLMHIGVAQGGAKNQTFLSYIDHLATTGYVPPNGKLWIDHIRKKGNEATHEIVLMDEGDANDLLAFLSMLLTFIYEFPNKIPPQRA